MLSVFRRELNNVLCWLNLSNFHVLYTRFSMYLINMCANSASTGVPLPQQYKCCESVFTSCSSRVKTVSILPPDMIFSTTEL